MPAFTDTFKRLRLIVTRRGARDTDADDIVQEAFARLEAYTRVHEVRSQEAFLVTAATNILRDQMRRSRTAPFQPATFDLEVIADAAPQPDEVVRARERLRRATAGLRQLKPHVQRMVIAQRLEGLTFPQIAAREGMSVAAVEKSVARAVMFLTKWMDGW